ncbi:hypothetical protein E2C01_069717 [Portunus trituberculatus]|uniref:Uncharacterized protein n=1 Tax=Portunus trituberculatus TaxID=210409 RepID=A0A5B7HQS7_PORTR|nr:hypothetical protein [Portunus trituberculatus]
MSAAIIPTGLSLLPKHSAKTQDPSSPLPSPILTSLRPSPVPALLVMTSGEQGSNTIRMPRSRFPAGSTSILMSAKEEQEKGRKEEQEEEEGRWGEEEMQ